MSSAFVEEMTGKVQALGKGFSESSSTIDTSSITVKESIKGIRSVLYDLSVSSSEYAGTYRGVLEVFNNTSGSAANAQDAFNIVYNALKEAGVPLDELNKKLAQEFPSAAQATKSSVDSSIVEAQKTISSSTGKMKTDAETNLAGVKKAAEDASGGVNTTTVTNWGNSASEVKKNLDKMKQTANLKLGEMQKTVESHFSGQYNTMTKKWEKACERIGQLITQMVRSTKDSLNGLARNMNTIGNEMSNNLINGISGAVTGIAGILNEVVSKVNSTTPKNKTVNIIEQNKKEIFMDGCNENVIEFMTNDTRATLSFSQGRYKSVIRKLAEKHPEDCQIIADNEDGSICAHVPVSWLRISPPRQYTEEQRQQMGERLRQNRSENTVIQG